MDRLIYVAMTGAKHLLERQAVVAQNLANASTTGYRAAQGAYRSAPVIGEGLATRTFAVDTTIRPNFESGPLQRTGRDLDVAIQGPGWIAVQSERGEAYTRDGSLQVDVNGQLQTRRGLAVLGDGGPISIPPDTGISIAADGTVTATTPPKTVNVVGRIKLVQPPESQLVRGDDGLFRLTDGSSAPADPGVRLASGAIEGSNVNVVEEMISMISLARQFDLQMRLLDNAKQNAGAASRILGMNG